MTTTVGEAPSGTGWVARDDSFGARLVLVRQKKGWSNISRAARECGLSAENWRLWEQGREPDRLVTVAKQIAGASGCDYLWLLLGPDRESGVNTSATGRYASDRLVAIGRGVPEEDVPANRSTRPIRLFPAVVVAHRRPSSPAAV